MINFIINIIIAIILFLNVPIIGTNLLQKTWKNPFLGTIVKPTIELSNNYYLSYNIDSSENA